MLTISTREAPQMAFDKKINTSSSRQSMNIRCLFFCPMKFCGFLLRRITLKKNKKNLTSLGKILQRYKKYHTTKSRQKTTKGAVLLLRFVKCFFSKIDMRRNIKTIDRNSNFTKINNFGQYFAILRFVFHNKSVPNIHFCW